MLQKILFIFNDYLEVRTKTILMIEIVWFIHIFNMAIKDHNTDGDTFTGDDNDVGRLYPD